MIEKVKAAIRLQNLTIAMVFTFLLLAVGGTIVTLTNASYDIRWAMVGVDFAITIVMIYVCARDNSMLIRVYRIADPMLKNKKGVCLLAFISVM